MWGIDLHELDFSWSERLLREKVWLKVWPEHRSFGPSDLIQNAKILKHTVKAYAIE
jgi:hypothetical protein